VLGLRCRVGGAGGLLCEVPGRSLGRLGLALPRRRGGRGFAAVLYGRESIFSQTHQNRGPPSRALAHLPAPACQPPHVGRWVYEGKKIKSLPGDRPAQLVSSWRQLLLPPGNKK